MDVGEFIDTYSDDLLTIHEARAAAYTHPLRGDYAIAEWLLDASFCRVLAVFVIGGIEVMLESWRERDKLKVLGEYFARNVTNGDRVGSLYRAFVQAGIHVDKEVFNDYLAIKYLRNTIIHGRWKEYEKDWLDVRGFPTDARRLSKDHLNKIEHVYLNMMLYIALTGLADSNAPRPAKLVKLDEALTRRRDDSGILRTRDIARIIWNNLERIDAHIYRDVEQAVVTKEYDWTEGRSRDELDALGHEECKRLFYLAARRAGEENYERLAQHRDLAAEALDFWREYWWRAVALSGLEDVRIRRALKVFQSPHFDPAMPLWSIIGNVSDDVAACRMVDSVLTGGKPLSGNEIVDALRAGRLAYQVMPNIMPVGLFTVRLPIVDPANTVTYLQEAERALDLFRLNRTWYSCVEYHRAFTDESLHFYTRIIQEFAERAQE